MATVANPYENQNLDEKDFALVPKADPVKAAPGMEADPSGSNLLNFAAVSVKATDQFLGNLAEERARNTADDIQNEWMVANGMRVPAGIRLGESKMETLQAKLDAGTITPLDYYTKLDLESRNLKAHFYGYSDRIDQAFRSVTGINPANAIQEEFAKQARQAQAQTSEQQRNFRERLEWATANGEIGAPPPNKDGSPLTYDQLEKWIGQRAALAYRTKQLQEQMNRDIQNQAFSDRREKDLAEKVASNTVLQHLQPEFESFTQVMTNLNKAIADGSVTTEMRQQAQSALLSGSAKVYSAVQDALVGSPIPQKDKNDIAEQHVERLRRLGAIGENNIDAFNVASALEREEVSGTSMNLSKNLPVLRAVNSIYKSAGPNVAELVLRTSLGKDGKPLLDGLTTGIAEFLKTAAMDPNMKAPSFNDVIAQINDAGGDGEAAAKPVYDSYISVLNSGNLPDDIKMQALNILFDLDGKEANIITSVSPEEVSKEAAKIGKPNDGMSMKQRVFARLMSPDIYKEVKRLSDAGHPEAMVKYQTFRESVFKVLFASSLNEAKEINETVKNAVRYDPETQLLSLEPRNKGFAPELGPIGQTIVGVIEDVKGATTNSPAVVNRLNMIFQAMKPQWEAEGLDPNVEIQKVLDSAGVAVNNFSGTTSAAEQGVMNLQKNIVEALRQGWQNLTTPPDLIPNGGNSYTPGMYSPNQSQYQSQDKLGGDAGYDTLKDQGNGLPGAELKSRMPEFWETFSDGLMKAGFNQDQADKIGQALEMTGLPALLGLTNDYMGAAVAGAVIPFPIIGRKVGQQVGAELGTVVQGGLDKIKSLVNEASQGLPSSAEVAKKLKLYEQQLIMAARENDPSKAAAWLQSAEGTKTDLGHIAKNAATDRTEELLSKLKPGESVTTPDGLTVKKSHITKTGKKLTTHEGGKKED